MCINETQAKPFLKWAGGKGQLIDEISLYYPFSNTITKYAEPFVGGGAILFDILNKFKLESIYISDINTYLINTYKIIRDEAERLIEVLNNYQNEFVTLTENERKKYYNEKREHFNSLQINNDKNTNIILAALMIFLNKTCFNGLYRVNKKGDFNVPIGRYKKPLICDTSNLYAVSKKLNNVNIICGDYKLSDKFIDNKTFVYFDPPYRPLSNTSNFTSYSSSSFGDKEQKELAEFVNILHNKGAKIIVSNSDPKNTDSTDLFFDNLYSSHHLNRIFATRMINSKGGKRGKISELLITTY